MTKNYIRFSKVAGYSTWHIITKHILPATLGEIAVLATLDIGGIILNISAMSFLGLGVQPPTAEWGMMLNEAKTVLYVTSKSNDDTWCGYINSCSSI